MKIYNSLTKQLDTFSPSSDKITIYSCGPTVYERAHIGNLASFIYADTLRRVLETRYPDKQVIHVMNITDIDDKTIAASSQRYPELEPHQALTKLTREYENLFLDDLKAVGVDIEKFKFVRATENIDAMKELIQELVSADIAYTSDDGVYFSIAKYQEQGKKYGQLVDITTESTGRARVNNDEYDKENIHDFALWKLQKDNEPSWDFEINGHNLKGRPGWHIECSAMSVKYLGQPFDFHTGGVDLKFPHHENEIAQSTAATDKGFASIFVHSEHILLDGKKMSKSLNNFYTLDDIKSKGYDPLALRMLVLQAHYGSQAHFSWDNLEAANNRLKNLRIRESSANNSASKSSANAYLEPVQNDVNTPELLSLISGDQSSPLDPSIEKLLGLHIVTNDDITDAQKSIIAERSEAKQNKDYEKADQLRQQLHDQGIGINDTDGSSTWFRI